MGDHVATIDTVTVYKDALSRALRTLYIAIGVDAAGMIGGGLLILLKDYDVSTEAFWIAFGLLTVKSVLTSLGAFLLRLKNAPKAEKEREALLPVDHIPVK